MVPYVSWIFLVLVGIDPGVSRLGGEIVDHYTTDAQQFTIYWIRDPFENHYCGLSVFFVQVVESCIVLQRLLEAKRELKEKEFESKEKDNFLRAQQENNKMTRLKTSRLLEKRSNFMEELQELEKICHHLQSDVSDALAGIWLD